MDEEPAVARDILSHLLAHTDAQDTREGIVEWWLLETQIRRAEREVAEALDWLVEQSFVLRARGADSKTRYRLNRDRLPRIRELLGTGGGPSEPLRSIGRKES
jgi:hypothetical protein